jgi:hypothetical protein
VTRLLLGIFVAALAAGLPPPVGSQRADGPGVRNAHGLAFDGQLTVLFGGADAAAVRGDTWGWDGSAWTRLQTAGPSPRTFPVMAAGDAGEVHLFGGRRVLFGRDLDPSQFLADLWRWTGHDWVRIDADGPAGRAEAAAAWDPRRRRLVVFGGYTVREGVVHRLGDTWEFGDGRWHERTAAGPSARNGAVAAFDHALGEVVLFGGSGAVNDTWAWNGERWRRLEAGAPPGRYNAAMASGPARSVLRFGGWDGRRRQRDTWTLLASGWRPVTGAGPGPRNHSAMAFDARRGRVVLVGGHDGDTVFGDVWEMAERRWLPVLRVPSQRRIENGH